MSSPRFAVAARELEGAPRGVHRWLAEVLAAWRASGRDRDVTLWFEAGPPAGIDLGAFEVRATGPGPGGGATAWEQVALARALRGERPRAVLGPANAVPLRAGVPKVIVLHDLSFEALPASFGWREGTRRRALARLSARAAARVVAVSEFTAGEVRARYPGAAAKVRVVRNGVAACFRPVTDPAALDEARRRHGLEGEVVLSVGSQFQRRHPVELFEAVASLAAVRPTLRLVLVGDDRTRPPLRLHERLASLGLAPRTVWIERVDDEELRTLYSLAAVCVYLSDYEGFGLPPLEALACGAPVVASASEALRENLAGHATLIEQPAPAAIAAAIQDALSAPMAERVRPAWLEALTWERTAEGVMRVLEEAAP